MKSAKAVAPAPVSIPPYAVDVRSAAAFIGTSPWQIRQLTYNNELRPIRLGKKFLFRVADLKEFVDRKAEAA